MAFDQVSNHFGVCFRGEDKTLGLEPCAQRLVVFDDAVVDHRQACTDMGMGVGLGRRAVRGPAGVGDAEMAVDLLRCAVFRQRRHPAHAAHPFQAAVDGDQPGRIVAAIFQSTQALEQDGNNVALRYRANNSAHD